MKKLTLAAALLGLISFTAAHADGGAELAQKKNCLGCHAADKKMVGPSYKDIAAKYKGDKAAQAKLAEKMQKGGSGNWGQVAMPPNPQLTDAEAKTLADWILGMH